MTADRRSKVSILGSIREKNTFGNFLQENEILTALWNSATTGHLNNFWEKWVRLHEIYKLWSFKFFMHDCPYIMSSYI